MRRQFARQAPVAPAHDSHPAFCKDAEVTRLRAPTRRIRQLVGWLFLLSPQLFSTACSRNPESESRAEASAGPSSVRARRPHAPSQQVPKACAEECNSIETCTDGRCVPHCPDGEVYIPSTGPEGFEMGHGEPGEFDQRHRVVLTRPFCIDETEVTVAAYRKCVEAGACSLPVLRDENSNYRPEFKRPDHPVNMVNWMQSKQFCEHIGKTLPTEAQFEWAAGHGDGRLYPWGNQEPTCDNELADFTPFGAPKTDPAGDVGCHGGNTSPVKAHPKGNSSWHDGDVYDLGGNVWEWTLDCSRPYPAETVVDPCPTEHPALHGGCYVYSLRGGGWNRSRYALRVHYRGAAKRTYQVPGLGFRCVRNPD